MVEVGGHLSSSSVTQPRANTTATSVKIEVAVVLAVVLARYPAISNLTITSLIRFNISWLLELVVTITGAQEVKGSSEREDHGQDHGPSQA